MRMAAGVRERLPTGAEELNCGVLLEDLPGPGPNELCQEPEALAPFDFEADSGVCPEGGTAVRRGVLDAAEQYQQARVKLDSRRSNHAAETSGLGNTWPSDAGASGVGPGGVDGRRRSTRERGGDKFASTQPVPPTPGATAEKRPKAQPADVQAAAGGGGAPATAGPVRVGSSSKPGHRARTSDGGSASGSAASLGRAQRQKHFQSSLSTDFLDLFARA